MAFCSVCGSYLNNGAAFCSHCGSRQCVQQYVQPVVMVKPKVPGRGLGISSMVLAIIGLVYAAILCIAGGDAFTGVRELSDLTGLFLLASLSLMGVIFGGAARSKGYTNGVSTSGLVMGIIGMLGYTYLILYIIAGM